MQYTLGCLFLHICCQLFIVLEILVFRPSVNGPWTNGRRTVTSPVTSDAVSTRNRPAASIWTAASGPVRIRPRPSKIPRCLGAWRAHNWANPSPVGFAIPFERPRFPVRPSRLPAHRKNVFFFGFFFT